VIFGLKRYGAISGWQRCRAVFMVVPLVVGAQFAVAQDHRVEFDIPSRPLDEALNEFGAVSGLQIFYESSLTAGEMSKAIRGKLDRGAALGLLLDGTGLAARAIAANTVSVFRDTASASALREAKSASVAYYGLMQAALIDALCQTPVTQPGSYEVVIQYWVGREGKLDRVSLTGSSGDSVRDAAIARVLKSVVFAPRVSLLPQPITFAVVKTAPEATPICAPASKSAGR